MNSSPKNEQLFQNYGFLSSVQHENVSSICCFGPHWPSLYGELKHSSEYPILCSAHGCAEERKSYIKHLFVQFSPSFHLDLRQNPHLGRPNPFPVFLSTPPCQFLAQSALETVTFEYITYAAHLQQSITHSVTALLWVLSLKELAQPHVRSVGFKAHEAQWLSNNTGKGEKTHKGS